MSKIECDFELLAGAVLKDVNGNMDFLCSNANITNDLALYHLKSNPNCIDQFQKLPDDLEEILEEYELPEIVSKALEAKGEADKLNLDKANGIIENQKTEIGKLEGELKEKTDRITELEEDNEELQTKVEEQQAKEIARLNAFHQVGNYDEKIKEEEHIDNEEVDLDTLNRAELIDFIKVNELPVEVTGEMSDDDIRDAIVAEAENQDSTVNTATQQDVEDALVLEIAGKLKAGVTKGAIKEEYKGGQVGEKNLTVRFLDGLIARADELNK